ncbi:hypothetical protein [Flavobacterium sp.]|uniref:hypothetical protein n=1 Tax=Flavobacterium sp. TaxID=239 RepID=UPI0039E2883A
MTALLFLFFVLQSCVGARPTVQIPDYIVVADGQPNIGGKNLHAFIFENNVKAPYQIEQFLAKKYNTANYFERELWVTMHKDKYKLIVYDNSDFEKYFNSANYSPINEETKSDQYSNTRKFIAISVINAYNEDCLEERSLLRNITVKYLEDLKNEYISQ